MHIVKIPKKSGGFRLIYVPDSNEKQNLKKMIPELQDIAIQRCPYAHAFIPNRSVVTAALLHRNKAWTICCDLKDFFDSCTQEMLEEENIRHNILRKVLIDGAPRQGLPTSPILANIAAAKLDEQIVEFLKSLDEKAVYTRYADDLSISSDSREVIDTIRKQLPIIVEDYGFKIHPNKWQIQDARFGNRVICGVSVGSDIKASRSFRRKLRAAKHNLSKNRSRKNIRRFNGLREWAQMRLPMAEELRLKLNGHEPSQALIEALDLNKRIKRNVIRKTIKEFDTKSYLRAYKEINPYNLRSNEYIVYAVGLACTFGTEWKNWLDFGNNCKRHDLVYWLPRNISPKDGFGKRLLKWRREIPNLLRRSSDLEIIAKHWHSLTNEERNLSFKNLLTLVKSKVYIGAKHLRFAEECAKHGVNEDDYIKYESRWLRRIKSIKYETIPRIYVKEGEYSARILDRDDPRGLWVGEHTACCQHPDGEGSSSAWHGATNQNGSILVIEKGDVIVAQSWLWRSGDVVVADNCEALHGYDHILSNLYEKVAKNMVGKLCVSEFRIGTRGDIDISSWEKADAIQPPSGCYTDAEKQVVIYKGE